MNLALELKLLKLRWQHNPVEVIESILGKITSGVEFMAKVGSDMYNTFHDPEEEKRPHLSNEAYDRIEIYLGKSKAEEVRRNVESGITEVKEAEEFSQKVELIYENSRGRRSIEPEEWQDFEEGWRPDDW